MSANQPISPLALYRNSCLQRQLNIQLRIYDKDMKASRRRLDGTRDECRDQLRILKSERRAYLLENAVKNMKLMEEMGYQRTNTSDMTAFEQSLKQRKISHDQTSPNKRRPNSAKRVVNSDNVDSDNTTHRSVNKKSTRAKDRMTLLRPFTSRAEYISTGNSNYNLTDGGSSTATNDITVGELTPAFVTRGMGTQRSKRRPSTAWEVRTEEANVKFTQNSHFKPTTKTDTESSVKRNITDRDVIVSPRTVTFSQETLPYRYNQPGIRRPHSAPICTMYTSSNKRFTGISKKEKAGIKADMEKHVQQTKELVEKSKRLKKYIRRVTGIEEQEEEDVA